MLNIWELRTLGPPPPSAGPTVRVCRYVMDFDVALESEPTRSLDFEDVLN